MRRITGVSFALLLAALPLPLAAKCVSETWGGILNPDPQKATLIEKIEHPKGEIHAYKFNALKGQYAKLYVFLRTNETCYEDAVSIGSYAMTAMMHDGPKRLFHADYYTHDQHATLNFFEGRPKYKAMRAMALETFQ